MRENYEIRKSYLLLFEYKHTYYVSTAEGHQFDNQTFVEHQQSLKIQHFGYWLIGWNLALLMLLFFQFLLFVSFLYLLSGTRIQYGSLSESFWKIGFRECRFTQCSGNILGLKGSVPKILLYKTNFRLEIKADSIECYKAVIVLEVYPTTKCSQISGFWDKVSFFTGYLYMSTKNNFKTF